MRRNVRSLFLLLLVMFSFLQGTSGVWAEAALSVIRTEEIEALFDAYLKENDFDPELISVAYEYTATGERWYHREDQWYYSASLYKVPLMMLLTEREYQGELTKDTVINGMTLEAIEEEVLVNSNNPIAYSTLLYIAQPDVCRRMFCRYSDLPEEYYTWDFYGGSYFTARFMTDVMSTLYQYEEQFPRMTECLKRAQPDHYFRLKLGNQWKIAQKYGTYQEEDGTDWNHTSGIIYTPHPFILTVMTRYGGISETIISDLAVLFCEYTLQADSRLLTQKETPTGVIPAGDQPDPAPVQNMSDETSSYLTPVATEVENANEENASYSTGELDLHDSVDPEGVRELPGRESELDRPVLIVAALGIEVVLVGLALWLRHQKRDGRSRRRRR